MTNYKKRIKKEFNTDEIVDSVKIIVGSVTVVMNWQCYNKLCE